MKEGRITEERVLPTGSSCPRAPPDWIHHLLMCSYRHERGRRHRLEGGGRQREEREREVAVGTEREEPRGVVIRVRWSFIHQERGVALGLPVGRYGRCSNEL
jgi:hypothetical protein